MAGVSSTTCSLQRHALFGDLSVRRTAVNLHRIVAGKVPLGRDTRPIRHSCR